MAGTLFTGCGSNTAQQADLRIGMIKNLNASENLYDDITKKAEELGGIKITNHKYSFYDSLTLLQMGIESGSIDEASTYQNVANYLMAKNPNKFELSPKHDYVKLSDKFAFAMRETDTELKNSINAAIEAMQNDGTLDNLIKTYITDLKMDEDPPAVEFENFDGAKTIKVAVTGDLPPLDLITAEGKPAGFNTAMLAEIGKRLNANIETVQIESGARSSALVSGNADIIFWAIVPADGDRPANIDTPNGTIVSTPYFQDQIVHLIYKK